MNLRLTDEQEMLRDAFAELFATESSPDRVRSAEPLGFDQKLWEHLVETGAVGMRVPEQRGGSGAGLLEASLIAEQAGRHLASGPLVETMVACGLLSQTSHERARAGLDAALDGQKLVTLALGTAAGREPQLVPGGAVADLVVGLDGDELVLLARSDDAPALRNLGDSPIARWCLSGGPEVGERHVLARDDEAHQLFERAIEERKLLTAAALLGLSRRALEIAAEYASERIQFDRPIGAFQAIAHPLANAITSVEGGRVLTRQSIWAIARGREEAAALISLAYAWAADCVQQSVGPALHTHGGYGLSVEYDIQLYHRRGKAWALLGGDPRDELQHAVARRFEDVRVALPDAGEVQLEFSYGEETEAFRAQIRRFFDEHLTDELRARAHYSWDGHDDSFHKTLADHQLLYPTWPTQYGGQDRSPYDAAVLSDEFHRVGWTTHAISTTRLVAETLMHYGTEDLKLEVLPRVAAGDALISLGYTEPHSGSDVANAQTRAVRDGDEWVINGQKMFTSGANLAQYIFLLTRTNPEVRKHHGLTMFLVPTDQPGVEIQPIHTLSDERTNATYYSDVRIPDRFRIGGVDEGWTVLRYALALEHGGGAAGAQGMENLQLVEKAAEWARDTERRGRPALEDPRVRDRIGYALMRAHVTRALGLGSLWAGIEGEPDTGQGPMVAMFGPETYIEDSADLLDLAAPDSILKKGEAGAAGDGEMEWGYRLSQAMSIYGGTSEIMRSIIAQASLGMPRSRS